MMTIWCYSLFILSAVVMVQSSNFTGDEEFQATIWIDVPWRHCVQEYNNLFAGLQCDENNSDQVFSFGKSWFISPLFKVSTPLFRASGHR